MTLKGIDISNWQHTGNGGYTAPFLNNIGKADFVITKATQGTNYVNPYWASDYAYCKKQGKLMGVYHYAGGGSARNEADYFYSKVKSVIGEAIPCLDWEANQNAAWGNTAWAWSFAQRFHDLSGVWPMIYVQASAIRQVAACANYCALWVAGYPDLRDNWNVPAFPYSIAPWKFYTVWQFSSGGAIDRNTAKLDAAGWRKIAAGDNTPDKQQDPGKPVNDYGLTYRAHVERFGWLPWVHDGQTAGTTGKGLRLEAIEVGLPDGFSGEAWANIQGVGYRHYTIEKGKNCVIGTTGEKRRLEALILDIEGPEGFTAKYRVHIEKHGWLPTVPNHCAAGTQGLSLAAQAVKIWLEKA